MHGTHGGEEPQEQRKTDEITTRKNNAPHAHVLGGILAHGALSTSQGLRTAPAVWISRPDFAGRCTLWDARSVSMPVPQLASAMGSAHGVACAWPPTGTQTTHKPDSGFIDWTDDYLTLPWWVYQQGAIALGTLRVWLGTLELVEKRCGACWAGRAWRRCTPRCSSWRPWGSWRGHRRPSGFCRTRRACARP